MSTHSSGEPGVTAVEPAAIAEIARLVVAALVAVGVFEVDDATWNAITLVIGGLISVALTWWTRRRATPLAAPHNAAGAPLIPNGPPGAHRAP